MSKFYPKHNPRLHEGLLMNKFYSKHNPGLRVSRNKLSVSL